MLSSKGHEGEMRLSLFVTTYPQNQMVTCKALAATEFDQSAV